MTKEKLLNLGGPTLKLLTLPEIEMLSSSQDS